MTELLTGMSTVLRVKVRNHWYTVEVVDLESSPARVLVDGRPVEVSIETQIEGGRPVSVREHATGQPSLQHVAIKTPAAPKAFTSPMPGTILSVAVKVGDQVVTGDEICVLEAMKMQQILRADWSGIVKEVHVQPAQQVLNGDHIIDLE